MVFFNVFAWQCWLLAVSQCGISCDLISHTSFFANSSLRAEKTLQIEGPTPYASDTLQTHARLQALFIVCGCWRLLSELLNSRWSVVLQNGHSKSQLSCLVCGRVLPLGCAHSLGKSSTCIIRTTQPQELHCNGAGTKQTIHCFFFLSWQRRFM